jgi:hypothetical protein
MIYLCGGVIMTSSLKGTDIYFEYANDNQICKSTTHLLRTTDLVSACIGDAGSRLSLSPSRSTFMETCFIMYKVLSQRLLHPEKWILHDDNQ